MKNSRLFDVLLCHFASEVNVVKRFSPGRIWPIRFSNLKPLCVDQILQYAPDATPDIYPAT